MTASDNSPALYKITGIIKASSVLLFLLHIYAGCYPAMRVLHFTTPHLDGLPYRPMTNIPLLSGINTPKTIAVLLLVLSVIGDKGKKDEKLTLSPILYTVIIGILLYYLSTLLLHLTIEPIAGMLLYVSVTVTGYLSILTGCSRFTRLLRLRYNGDIFNELSESFPQEEQLIKNEYSVHFRTEYHFRGKKRQGWLNLVNVHRHTLVAGLPGAGKSWFVLIPFMKQQIEAGCTMFVYDLKFPDLSRIMYNHLLKHQHKYPIIPSAYFVNFDDLSRTHRCNVLAPQLLLDLSDAQEASRTLMMALNKEWVRKSGEFFVESSLNFVAALFWFLKKYEGGKYCTLPHCVELAQVEYKKLFPVLSLEPDIDAMIGVFISAWKNNAAEQLEGQIGSARIGLARLVSPAIYWVLSGNDFTLDINNPAAPKLVAMGSNPGKQSTYGAIISLYIDRMHKLVNRKHQLPCTLLYDEYSSLSASVEAVCASGRSNKIAVVLGIQDVSQLAREYGKEQAEVIAAICGNIISGQVIGQSAKDLSERIGKINQERESLSINANDTSLSKNTQLEYAIPPSRISNLSSGEFCWAVADTPQQPLKIKIFHGRILNDPEVLAKEEAAYLDIPIIRHITDEPQQNFYRIKQEVRDLIDQAMARIEQYVQTTEGLKQTTQDTVSL